MAEPVPDFAYEGADLEATSTLARYRDWVLSGFYPYLGGACAEIGAGIGSYSKSLLPHVDSLFLVEPSPTLYPRLAGRFADTPGVTVSGASAEAWLADRRDASLDCVVMINVLEHIADDAAVLGELHRVLTPGGRLLLFVPALQALYSKIDALVGHHRRYKRSELEAAMRVAGLEILASKYFDLIGIVPWWLVNKVMGATAFNPRMTGLYDAVAVPIGRRLEAVIVPPVGKNVLMIARRPAG